MLLEAGHNLYGSRYEIVKYLGEGAWGIVYLADDRHLSRKVAIKLLRAEIANKPDEVSRFSREPRISAQIASHHNIVYVHDFIIQEPNVGSYMVMEYVNGGSLKDYLKKQECLPLLEIVHFGLDLCQALEAIHEKNILHLDLKPDNIMLRNSIDGLIAKVSDFGTAIVPLGMRSDLALPLPTDYYRLGEGAYASPERLDSKTGEGLDNRADLYSLGAILYEMATGFPPFQDEAKSRAGEALPTPPTHYTPSIPEDLEKVILRALHKKRENRFNSAGEMLEILQQVRTEILTSMNRFDRLFNEAKSVFEQGKWAEALDKFKALAVTSDHRKDETIKQYIEECHKFTNLEANYQKAKDAFIANKWAIAVELLREVVQGDQDYRDGEAHRELEQALRRLEAHQELQKGLSFIDQQEWQQALSQLNMTRSRFPELTNEGEVLEEIDHSIAEVQRRGRLAGLYQRFQDQIKTARSTMTPESWQEAVSLGERLLSRAPDSVKYQNELREAQQQLHLTKLYRQALSAEAAGNWSEVVRVYQEIQQLDRHYRDVIVRLAKAEDQVKRQKLRQEVEEELDKDNWPAAMEKLKEIRSILPNDQETIKLSKELAIGLEALEDKKGEAWSKGIEKLNTLTHPLLINRVTKKISDFQLQSDLAERYKIGEAYYQIDEWRQALPVFKEINQIAQTNNIAPYKDTPKFLAELNRRVWLDKAARRSAGHPRLVLGGIIIALLLLIALVWEARSLMAPLTPPTVEIDSLEVVSGVRLAPNTSQTITKEDQVEIIVQAKDKAGKFLAQNEITCNWSFIPAPEPPDFRTQDECVIKYQMPASLEKQTALLRVKGKENTSITGGFTTSIDFVLSKE